MQRAIRIQNLTNYTSIHSYLRRYKKGVCEQCGRQGKTHLAKRHSKKHERKIENYKELCPKHHLAYDRTKGREMEWLSNLAKSHSHRNRIKPKACGHCLQSFTPKRKSNRFCSNVCSGKWRAKNGKVSWLALNKSA